MKWVSYLVCLFFLFPASLATRAQVPKVLPLKKVPVNTINYEQGLLYNETAAVITDTLGFTWVSTTAGLQRYNGYSLQNIDPVINGDTIRIRSRVYFCGLKNGNLWIGCKSGILEYNPFTNDFKNIIPLRSRADEVFAIVPLCETAEGIWCLQRGLGMAIYGRDGRFKNIVPAVDTRILDGIIHSDYLKSSSMIVNNSGHIFIRTVSKSILIFDIQDHHFEEFFLPAEQPGEVTLPGEQALGIACNADFFYVSTQHNVFKFRTLDRKLIKKYPLRNITVQPVEACGVYYIGDKHLIITVNDQVIEFDDDLNNPRLLTTFSGQPILLAGSVEHLYRDAFARIWILTNDDIKRIQDKEIPFSYLKYPGPNGNFVRCLYFDEQSRQLLAGCINGGIQAYDSSSNPLWRRVLRTDEAKDILSIEKLSPNTYLIVTWIHGWYLLDLQRKKLSKFDFRGNEKLGKALYLNAFSSNVQRINDSTLIVSAVSNVFRCVFRGNVLKSAKALLPFYKTMDDRIGCAYQASDGCLWIGLYQGSVYLMSKNGVVKTVKLPEKFSTRCFAEDAGHHIWIGTSSGLYACSMKGDLLGSFYKRSGLLNDCIYSLLPLPRKSSVIAATNMGLSDIALNGNIKNYTKELGLQDNEFNTGAALITSSGKFYVGGVNGINSFYPESLDEGRSKLVLNMTRLIVNDSAYNAPGIWKGDALRLKYDQNHIQFDFAAMGPLNADKYFYKYRLIGFEKNWQSTHEPIGIRYILQPGSYTLEVACSNELSGPEVKKNILIIVNPPFWQRWWFFAIIGFCAIGTIALIVTYYNKRRYQKTLQELMVKQRLQNQRERISRDLHDNLGAQANAIFYGTELLKKNNDPEHTLVENLHDTARDMLTVLRETLWAMKITQVEACDLWLRVLNFTRKLGTYYPGITMAITGEAPAILTLSASTALNMILIVQEAINNAVRHSDASLISINSYCNTNSWRIEIIDNGKGFDVSSRKSESYGLENMAERAHESNIAFDINSLLSHGTKVYVEVDLSKMVSQVI